MQNLFEPLSYKNRTLILDTDIGPDCDDAGAIAILFHMQKEYGFLIGGMVNSTSDLYGTKALMTLCKYYGYYNIPIGQFSKPDGVIHHNKYNKYITQHILPNLKGPDNPIMGSLELYKSVLEAAKDDEVIIVTIGSFLAVSEALKIYPTLFENKVHAVISMAGCFNMKKREFNAVWHIPSTQYFFDNFKNTIICTGLEVGIDIITGFENMNISDSKNPVKKAYFLFTEGINTRPSWDLTAIHFAVKGCSDFYELSDLGHIHFTDDGITEFTTNKQGRHMYIKKKAPNQLIADYLNNILTDIT